MVGCVNLVGPRRCQCDRERGRACTFGLGGCDTG